MGQTYLDGGDTAVSKTEKIPLPQRAMREGIYKHTKNIQNRKHKTHSN